MPLHMRARRKGQPTRGISRRVELASLGAMEAASERDFTPDEAEMLIGLAAAIAGYLGRTTGTGRRC